jgi:DNA-binding FadR family transcriptional regulator
VPREVPRETRTRLNPERIAALLEARREVEPRVAVLAGQRATRADLRAMAEAVELVPMSTAARFSTMARSLNHATASLGRWRGRTATLGLRRADSSGRFVDRVCSGGDQGAIRARW